MKKTRRFVSMGFCGLALLVIMSSCGGSKKEDGSAATTEASAKPESKWEYSEAEDKMGGKSNFAQLEADEELDFKFPYDGGSTATLTVQHTEQGDAVLFQVSKGQIVVQSITTGTTRVKFDDEQPFQIATAFPSDHSRNAIFLSPEKNLIEKLKLSKKMILEVEFYQGGATRQIEFDVQGFEWK